MQAKNASKNGKKLKIKNILFATDLSSCSMGALPWAIEFARLYKAKLTIAHVLESWDERYDFLSKKMASKIEKEARSKAKEKLASISEKGGIRVKAEILKGHPVLETMKVINKLRPELVVVGSHGKGGFSRLTLGSVSEKLVKVSTSSILVVRGSPPVKFNSIACAVDGSPSCLLGLDWTADIATRAGCKKISLCNAFETPIGYTRAGVTLKTVTERILSNRKERLAASLKGRFWPDIETHQAIKEGPIAATLCKIAEQKNASLLLMGARGRTALGGMLLGSVTLKVLRSAPMPVLAVKSPKHIVDIWEALKSL